MNKQLLISGIVFVFLLEVAFGVHVAFERKGESTLMARKNSVEAALPTVDFDSVMPQVVELNIVDAFPNEESGESIETAAVDEDAESNRKISTTYLASEIKKKTDRDLRSARKRVNPKVNVETATIADGVGRRYEYKTQAVIKPIEFDGELTAVTSGEAVSKQEYSPPDKKSFLAKTASVIKKPFGWMKALGSKLK
jgi:hypothetical protein